MPDASDRSAQRHRDPADAGHARGHAGRRGRRRRLPRRPDRQPPRRARRRRCSARRRPCSCRRARCRTRSASRRTRSPATSCSATSNCHIYNYEAGGPAVLSGVTCRTIEGDYGILDVSQLEDKIRPDQRSPGADAPGLPGEHAQPRRRPHLSAGEDPGDQRLGAADTA